MTVEDRQMPSGWLPRSRAVIAAHPLVTYAVLAYGLAWGYWLLLIVNGDTVVSGRGWPTHLPGLAAPAVAAVATTAAADGRSGLRDLGRRILRVRVPVRWYGFIAATAALGAVGIAIQAITADEPFSWSDLSRYTGTAQLGLVGVFLVALVVNGFGEEIGWRGFMVERLSRTHALLPTALMVAAVWGGWHLPMFLLVDNFRTMGLTIVGWAVGLVAGSLVLAWLYLGARHSIFIAALWHTTYNFTAATDAASGIPAALTSTAVIVIAVVIGLRVALEQAGIPYILHVP